MKKIYKVSKLFTATIIFYALFLVAGVALIFVKGVQKGVDFQSGLVAKVRFAPTVLALKYEGTDSVTFSQGRYPQGEIGTFATPLLQLAGPLNLKYPTSFFVRNQLKAVLKLAPNCKGSKPSKKAACLPSSL